MKMIDIYDARNSLAGFYLNKKYEFTEKNISNLIEIVKAIEEVKMIMEVLKNGSFGSYRDPANWLEKYFEEQLGNNGEPIKNTNPEEDISERMWEESDPFDGREEP